MTPDFWAGVAACLLSLAVIAGGLAFVRMRGPWDLLAIVARLAGAGALLAAVILAGVAQGEGSLLDLQQVVLALVLALLLIHQVLAWRLRMGSAGPLVDLLALILLLVAALVVSPGAPVLTCAQRMAPFRIQWLLFLFGGGSVLVAGCAGLMLALRNGLVRLGLGLRLPSVVDLHSLLTEATFLALLAIGAGLMVSGWWAWRTVGMLAAGDPREMWMAATWLVTAVSLSAWQLKARRGRWAAGLAVLAAVMVIAGLLALANQ